MKNRIDIPLISVAVITYNSANTIIETLDSIYNQTYLNIELIISDDGSKDDTVEICREWTDGHKDRFKRTEIITVHKNTGVTANYKRASENCRGAWIKEIDGDDLLLPNCLELYMQYVNEHPETIYLFGKVDVFGANLEKVKNFTDRIFDNSFFFLSQEQQYEWLIIRAFQPIASVTSFYNKEKVVKRIIWAPHHTIEGDDQMLKFSTFLVIADQMLELAKKYSNELQIAFKPHPELKWALFKHPQWGKERTEQYYSKWANGNNTTLETGEYVDLFVQSDAMIHDCGSFLVEYLYVNKPVMFMTNYDRESQCNEVGKKALRCHYHGRSIEDIDLFIKDVVIGGKDTMKETRISFYKNVLEPPTGKSVAENIVDCIKKELHK